MSTQEKMSFPEKTAATVADASTQTLASYIVDPGFVPKMAPLKKRIPVVAMRVVPPPAFDGAPVPSEPAVVSIAAKQDVTLRTRERGFLLVETPVGRISIALGAKWVEINQPLQNTGVDEETYLFVRRIARGFKSRAHSVTKRSAAKARYEALRARDRVARAAAEREKLRPQACSLPPSLFVCPLPSHFPTQN